MKQGKNKKDKAIVNLPFSGINQRTYHSSLTAKAVFCQHIEPDTLETAALYVFKSPYWGKTVNAFGKGKDRKIILLDDPNPKDGMRFLMLARTLSYLIMRDIFVSSREGQHVVNSALSSFSPNFPKKYPLRMSLQQRQRYEDNLSRAWESAQKSRVKEKYEHPEIRRRNTDRAIDTSNTWVKKYTAKLLNLRTQRPSIQLCLFDKK